MVQVYQAYQNKSNQRKRFQIISTVWNVAVQVYMRGLLFFLLVPFSIRFQWAMLLFFIRAFCSNVYFWFWKCWLCMRTYVRVRISFRL